MGQPKNTFVLLCRRDFLALEPMNVFGVGWPECSHVVLYEKTLVCAEQVGMYMGELVKWLSETTGLSPSNVHAVGHSLGGQVVSFISKVVQIARVTGADPAGPLFQHVDASVRLDPSDAQFVEAFHTSTSILGMKTPVGHVDFFPNGGVKQPGCEDLFGDCAHGTAYKFYGYTVAEANRQAYKAFQCESIEQAKNQSCTGEPTQIMGYGTSLETRGIYYLNIPSVP